MIIFSIKNEKIGFFNRPMFYNSSNECIAYIQNVLMSDADRALQGLKADLNLYSLGSIDFDTGKIVAFKHPVKVAELLEIFESIPEDRVPQTANVLRKRIEELEKIVKGVNSNAEDNVSKSV